MAVRLGGLNLWVRLVLPTKLGLQATSNRARAPAKSGACGPFCQAVTGSIPILRLFDTDWVILAYNQEKLATVVRTWPVFRLLGVNMHNRGKWAEGYAMVSNWALDLANTTHERIQRLACGLTMALVALVLVACGPTPLKRTDIAPLERIRTDFVQVVDEANASKETRWRSGWIGNVLVNWREGHEKGLCYHWQELVYKGVENAAKEVGWERVGIQINQDHHSEHHAVVVFDPFLISRDDLLQRQGPKPAFVLDAWRRGRPDVYRFDDWIKGSGWTKVFMVGLEDLDAEYAARDAEAGAGAAGVVGDGEGSDEDAFDAAPADASDESATPEIETAGSVVP